MINQRTVAIPTLVRIKRGALDRIGLYLRRAAFSRVMVLRSEGLDNNLVDRLSHSLAENAIEPLADIAVKTASIEEAHQIFAATSARVQAIIGLGGGKALDVAKYVSFLSGKPYFSIPTSLSNDGFCSPNSSLTVAGARRSLPSIMPHAVVIDAEVCMQAPMILWWSGVGDLVSKITAVQDWKLAFRNVAEPVDDFAALLSDSSVFQFMARPTHDIDGIIRLATALMLNGIAMGVCGSSRPASGSEHLISHALDALSARPRLHGLQVGIATYLISHLHKVGVEEVRSLFNATGFWNAIKQDPFSRKEWLEAIKYAPKIKENFYTILSSGDQSTQLTTLIDSDECLKGCFV